METNNLGDKAIILLRDLLETFPQIDPESDFFDEEVSGADIIDWINENAESIREIVNDWEKKNRPKSLGFDGYA